MDLRYASRALWRDRRFTCAAVVTLALGIAGTTVMFALIRGILLRPLPVHQQERLILSWKQTRTSGSARYPFGDTQIEAVARASRFLERVAGIDRNGVGQSVVIDGGVAAYANVGLVTGGFFDVLGVQPLLGRAFAPTDDRDGAERVVVISSRLWQERYGRSPAVIGRRLRIDERPFAIVGVMPTDLDFPAGVDIWMTTHAVPVEGPFGDAARRELNLVGRLRSGVTLEQATSEIVALNARAAAEDRLDRERDLVPVVRPFVDVVVADARPTLLALFAAVGLLLAIAAANVATLLLLRAERRRQEFVVRAALGAPRAALVAQVLAESTILSVAAGITGLTATVWMVHGLTSAAPDRLPRLDAIRIDDAVVLFSLAVAILSGFAAVIPAALSCLRADLAALGGGPRLSAASQSGRRALVVAQLALAVTVLATAGLMIRSVINLQSVDLGMPASRLVMLDLYMPPETFADRTRHGHFLDAAIEQLEALPPVQAATPVNIPPFTDRGWDVPNITGEGQDAAAANPSLNLESIHPNYFATLQIPLVRGRAFTTADRDGATHVAIVSEDVAARLWPADDPLGRRLTLGRGAAPGDWWTVVGVAGASRYRTLTTPRPTLYLPAAQFQMTATNIVVRTSAPLELVTSMAKARLGAVDPTVRVMRVLPFTDMLNGPLARPRFTAFLLGVFGVAALAVAAVGLFAVIVAYVHQRDRELAIRLALGATPAAAGRLVLAELMRLAGLGALVGVAGSAVGGRVLGSLLFEVAPLDPMVVGAAALLLVATSALASYSPLRRATRIDPAATLRAH